MSSSLYYLIIAITLSLLCQIIYKSALAFSKVKVLYVVFELNKQFALIVGSQKNYLQTNAFLNLMVVKWKEYPYALQKKATRKGTKEVIRETAGRT